MIRTSLFCIFLILFIATVASHANIPHTELEKQEFANPNLQKHTHTQQQQQQQAGGQGQQGGLSDAQAKRLEYLEKMFAMQQQQQQQQQQLQQQQPPHFYSPFSSFVHSPLAATGLNNFHHPFHAASALSPFQQPSFGLSPYGFPNLNALNYFQDPFSMVHNTQAALQRSIADLNEQLVKVEEDSITSQWHETDNTFVLDIKLPKGAKKDDLKVNARNNVLTVTGNVNQKDEKTGSVSTSSFTRVMSIPDEVEQSKINANLNNGILKITLPKSMKAIEEEKQGDIKIQHSTQQTKPVAASA